MTVHYIGKYLATVDNEIEARTTPFEDAPVRDSGFQPEMGYFGHPRMRTSPNLQALCEAVGLERVRFPVTPPPGLRQLAVHHLITEAGKLSDMAITYVESEMRSQTLAFGSRPLVPSDYALACFWTRRVGTPILYTALRADRVNLAAGVVQHPHEEVRIGPWPAFRTTCEALPGAPPLRGRWKSTDFVIWYDEVEGAWLSVRSRLVRVSALGVANALYSS